MSSLEEVLSVAFGLGPLYLGPILSHVGTHSWVHRADVGPYPVGGRQAAWLARARSTAVAFV